LDLWEELLKIPPAFVSAMIGAMIGALVGFCGSWFLQGRQFKRQKLDRARQKVYGPLSLEIEKIHQQIEDLGTPSREVVDSIRNQRLEWMVESRELRTKITELYDEYIPKYGDTIKSLTVVILRKILDDLKKQLELEHKRIGPDDFRVLVRERIDPFARDLVGSVLRKRLPDTEFLVNTRSNYEMLLRRVPRLECSNLDDYFARAIRLCEPEIAEGEEAKKYLQEKIKTIQRELEKLLSSG